MTGKVTSPQDIVDRFTGGGLFVNLLPPSLALPILSNSTDFFRLRKICARRMTEVKME